MESDNIYDVKNIIITNVQFEVEDDVFAYIPYIPDQYKVSSILGIKVTAKVKKR